MDGAALPYWVSAGRKRPDQRHVPVLPLNREVGRYARLRRAVALYRMAFGQFHQEDLLEFLQLRFPPAEAELHAAKELPTWSVISTAS